MYTTTQYVTPLLSSNHSVIPPNMLYAAFTTKDCITTGGYFLSIPNISSTFYGFIHSFILGTSVDGENLSPALYFRRVIHYLHAYLVVNNMSGIGSYPFYLVDTSFDDLSDRPR